MADVLASLKALHKRNPDGLAILSMCCGLSERRLRQLVRGAGEPMAEHERTILEAFSHD